MSDQPKSGVDLAADARISILAADLDISHGADTPDYPPIVVASDGSPEGTVLLVHGQQVPFKDFSIYCDRSEDYSSCSVHVTIEESNADGMTVERRLTLRKEPKLD